MITDNSIGDMGLDNLDIGQLEVVIRLALNAEIEYDNSGRADIANQCMVLRNRARARWHELTEVTV